MTFDAMWGRSTHGCVSHAMRALALVTAPGCDVDEEIWCASSHPFQLAEGNFSFRFRYRPCNVVHCCPSDRLPSVSCPSRRFLFPFLAPSSDCTAMAMAFRTFPSLRSCTIDDEQGKDKLAQFRILFPLCIFHGLLQMLHVEACCCHMLIWKSALGLGYELLADL